MEDEHFDRMIQKSLKDIESGDQRKGEGKERQVFRYIRIL